MPTRGRDTLAELIAQKVREAIGQALADVQPELEQIAKEGGDAAAGGLVGKIGTLSKVLSDVALVALVVDPPVGAGLEAIRVAENEGGKWAIGNALGYMMGYTAFSALNPLFMPLQHAIAHEFTNELHDPSTSAELVARGLFEHAHGADEASGSAIDGDHFARLVSLATLRPDVATALDLLRRGELSESFVRGELHHLGYATQTVDALMSLQRALLSPADLALARLRGNIDDTVMNDYAKQLGVDAGDMALLVENTGEPPGLEELLFAYRRGFIDKARLERGIRQSRVRNEWIDVVEKLRFAPMSTADAARAVIENYLTTDQGQAIAEQNGLEPEHWPTLVESYGRPLAHEQMGSLFHRGLASRAQFDQAMRESDIKDKYIGLSFDLTRRLLPERLIVQAIHFSAITLQEGSRMLLELGYDQEATGILLKLGLNEQHKPQHDLTRAELTSLYQDGVLSRADAEKHLTALGYSKQNADYVLTLSDTQQHAKELRAEQSATRNSYLAGGIDRVAAEAQLRSIGITQAQAEHLITVWDREKHRAARTLTETQIVKAATAGTIHADEAITLLAALGYSRADAAILLESHGVTIST